MGKTKQTGAASPIVNMTPQELLKTFVKEVGRLIDARIRTAETTIKANTDAAIKASEERTKEALRAEMKASEERLTKHILVLDARVLHRIEKVTERLNNHKGRIERLEEHVDLPPFPPTS